MKRILVTLLGAALAISSAFAQIQATDSPDVRDLPLGDARAIGLSGAMTAVNDDMNTLFFNPAGLAFLRKGYLNVNLGLGSSMFDQYNGSPDFQRQHPDKRLHMGNFEDDFYYTANPIQPNVVLGGKGWGLALTADYLAYVRNHDETEAVANADLPLLVSRRIGAVGGLGFNLGPVALGANVKYYTYSDYGMTFKADLGNNDYAALASRFFLGNGVDLAAATYEMDVGVGAVVTLGMFNVGAYYGNMMPFINAVINKESYSFDAYLGDCFKTMSLGASFMPSNDKFSSFKLPIDLLATVDLKNLGDNDERELCAGAEVGIDLWNFLVATARVGYSQALPTTTFSIEEMAAAFTPENGEITAGATAKVAMAKVDLSIQAPVTYVLGRITDSPYTWQEIKARATVSLCF
jgi:hypothetical protein